MSERLAATLETLLAAGEPAALVTVAAAKGSTPREAGAVMLVTAACCFGTIGGGRLEWEAIAHARALLAAGEAEAGLDLPLGPAVGQCCGGHVRLLLRRADAAVLAGLEAMEAEAAASLPPVLLFGAGHVGRALARALAPLPLRLRWIDGRAGEFPGEPLAGVETVVTEHLLDEVAAAPAGASYFVLTHSHALDFHLCSAVLERGDFAYLGLIGSKTKRARFEHGFRELGLPAERISRLVCPIGGSAVRDKRPAVIAALAAAELLVTLAAKPGTQAGTSAETITRTEKGRAA
ncbi:xanthine dehydrogenase accessory protein XdhC [Benzoatithermus flavus]|uniref:Xanthine dehydrogenase accessory protein XdhC n=1 Tax=Benzoatithermus flavus TaxID=3108223 RepID=A0ABU8XMY8_9PROT